MVKQVNIALDDEDFDKLIKAKNGMNWRDFIMKLAENKEVKDGSS